MKKLSIQLVEAHLAEEAEGAKAKYTSLKAPDGKSKPVGEPKDTSKKLTTIKQVEVPAARKTSEKSGKGQSGIPQAERGDKIVDKMPKSFGSNSKSKSEKSPTTPAIKKLKPNQTTKTKEVKDTIKRVDDDGKSKSGMPAANMAGEYTRKMPHGNHNLKVENGKTPEVKADAAKKLNGTTSPARSAVSPKAKTKDTQKVKQVEANKKSGNTPSDAPKKPSWERNANGHNVMESVQILINGRPKATFDVIDRNVAKKLTESYEEFGFDVSVAKGPTAAWKSDKELLGTIFESVDAFYNNAEETSKNRRKAAMNKFFQLSVSDYNNMYESKMHFSKTLKTAFDKIMENADIKYRQSLILHEGVARVQVGDDIIDLDMITQARDTDMALRNIKREIIEEYGFNAKVKHIFLEGVKFKDADIKPWK